MHTNAKFVSSTEDDATADDSHANGTAAKEDKSQGKATSDLADSIQSKVKVEDA